MSKTVYKTTMWAEMSPDLYFGDKCSGVKPRFEISCEGDMGSKYSDTITFNASDLPPGATILIQLPCCPICGQDTGTCKADEDCDFDWIVWRDGKYS